MTVAPIFPEKERIVSYCGLTNLNLDFLKSRKIVLTYTVVTKTLYLIRVIDLPVWERGTWYFGPDTKKYIIRAR